MDSGVVAGGVFFLRFKWETSLNQFGNICCPTVCPRCERRALSLGNMRTGVMKSDKDLTGTPYRPSRGARVGTESEK